MVASKSSYSAPVASAAPPSASSSPVASPPEVGRGNRNPALATGNIGIGNTSTLATFPAPRHAAFGIQHSALGIQHSLVPHVPMVIQVPEFP